MDATPLFRKALDLFRRVLGEDRAETAHAYDNLAVNLNAQAQYTEAEAFYRRIGGDFVERALALPPGGDPTRLHGTPWRLRVSWPAPRLLGVER